MGLQNFLGSQFIDIIEWLQSDDDTMVYRFPRYRNEIKYGAKLTVREGQTAILVNEGSIADVFTPGIYELTTANVPILSALQHWDHGFESPFKAEVYFFNTTNFLNQQWGTKQPILLNDKKFGIVRLRAYGSYTLRVKSAEVLLKKLVGTDGNFEIGEVSDQLTSRIASSFPEILLASNISVLELPTRYSELANTLKQSLNLSSEGYGLTIGDLYIENISLPENVQKALDDKASVGILKDDMTAYTQMQAAEGMSKGGDGSSLASAGVGMAIAMDMAEKLSSQNSDNDSSEQTSSDAEDAPDIPPPAPKIYYLMVLGERIGPVSISDVYDKLNYGEIDAHTMIWRKGMVNWQALEDTDDIDLSYLPPPFEAE